MFGVDHPARAIADLEDHAQISDWIGFASFDAGVESHRPVGGGNGRRCPPTAATGDEQDQSGDCCEPEHIELRCVTIILGLTWGPATWSDIIRNRCRAGREVRIEVPPSADRRWRAQCACENDRLSLRERSFSAAAATIPSEIQGTDYDKPVRITRAGRRAGGRL